MTVLEFMDALSQHLKKTWSADPLPVVFTKDEMLKIQSIADEKYRTWEWNFGKCPEFTLQSEDFTLKSKHGIITQTSSDDLTTAKTLECLLNVRLIPEDVSSALNQSGSATEALIKKIINELFV